MAADRVGQNRPIIDIRPNQRIRNRRQRVIASRIDNRRCCRHVLQNRAVICPGDGDRRGLRDLAAISIRHRVAIGDHFALTHRQCGVGIGINRQAVAIHRHRHAAVVTAVKRQAGHSEHVARVDIRRTAQEIDSKALCILGLLCRYGPLHNRRIVNRVHRDRHRVEVGQCATLAGAAAIIRGHGQGHIAIRILRGRKDRSGFSRQISVDIRQRPGQRDRIRPRPRNRNRTSLQRRNRACAVCDRKGHGNRTLTGVYIRH